MRISWWQWLPFWRWRIVGVADAADEIPDRLPRNGVALVGDHNHTKWIIFDCPCRTGHRIMVNGDLARRPAWVIHTASPLSIAPSIDYRGSARRCHYFVRGGRIVWAKDSDR